ncbi:type II toxin-antitoxin system RelE family toxin [Endozoicomonas acroporae]|uniref:type II toxin-antitoxin system RelE family toxin n=1 Tax=Endozoicomonas acroporae TaxID=1701104 RepID=UPI000C7787BD|nr:type II toxin-antitoxin system RelE/ParE family toxin [Endozoicomonas acroporae]
MSRYTLRWKRSALKELEKLRGATVGKLVALAESLVNEPFPDGCRKLSGTEHTWQVRTGNYRLVYQIDNAQLMIEVIKVGHHKAVYR